MVEISQFSQPLVSIGIPTYNGANRILNALESIQDQSYINLEILISDNASTDHTEVVCRRAATKDQRIRYFRQKENQGVTPNYEYVLQQATGTYFFWISDDDEMKPGVIEKYVDFLEANPDYSMVSGKINYWAEGILQFQESGFDLEQPSAAKRNIHYYRMVREGALLYGLMRREMGQQLRLWSTIGSDWHFVAGLAFMGKIKNLDFVGYNKETGGISSSFQNYAQVFGEKKIWGYLPYVKIAIDAFAEILWRMPIYSKLSSFRRVRTATIAAFWILFNFYVLTLPLIWGGKVLRALNIKTPWERRVEAMNKNLKKG